jgi:hypothetical protein
MEVPVTASPPTPPSRLGAWLTGVAPELTLVAVIVGGFLALGFLMGFDLPGP